jgi:PAS domain S-box-containing protein
MVADVIEELKPQLVRRVVARGGRGDDCLSGLVADLIASLRSGRVLARRDTGILAVGGEAEAVQATVGILRDCVFDVIEEYAHAPTPRESRLLAEWFTTTAEGLVREQNRRLGSILDALKDHIVLKDREQRLVYANRAARSVVRALVGDREVLGKTPAELGLPESLVRAMETHAGRAFAGEIVTGEIRFPLDGRWREHDVSPVLGADGSIDAVVVASRDIHARKAAEARLELLSKVSSLAESMEYQSILDSIAELVIPQLADWCVIDVVENGARRRGTVAHHDPAKAELIEKLLVAAPPLAETAQGRAVLAGQSLIVQPDQQTCTGGMAEIVRQIGARSMMIVPFVVLGSTVAIAKFVFAPESGRTHGLEDLALAEELARRAGQIIENARLHQELRRREGRFRVALEHAKVGIFEEDTDFRIRWMYNPQLGAFADSVIGRKTSDVLDAEEAGRLEALKRELLATGKSFRVEVHPTMKAETAVVVHYEPLRDALGTIVGLVGAGVDVTDERKAQQELAEALGFREQMMGVLGHDLRNPLSAVRGLSGVMLMQDELPAKVRESVKRIDLAARRMSEMIETLLDFTQSRFHGSLPVERRPMDLVEVTRNVVEELRVSHAGREIRLEAPEVLRGAWDAARMAQVVSNLVGNALTHGEAEAPVELSLKNGGSDAVLRVSNRGAPIPPELLGRMFEPFRRGEANGHGARSLGLGLYIVREIVARHGGTVDVMSTPATGTTFSVRLPRAA